MSFLLSLRYGDIGIQLYVSSIDLLIIIIILYIYTHTYYVLVYDMYALLSDGYNHKLYNKVHMSLDKLFKLEF